MQIKTITKMQVKINKKMKLIIASGLVPLFIFMYIFFIPMNSKTNPITLDVPPGTTFSHLALKLENQKLIRNSFYFKLLVRLYGSPVLQVGEYRLSANESLYGQFQKLRKGKMHYTLVTFSEGLNHYEMYQILKQQEWKEASKFLKLIWDPVFIKQLLGEKRISLEGYLFPETYGINKYLKAEDLLKQMVNNFLIHYQKISTDNSFSRHQAVTFASLIEKETGLAKERPLISSVFHNRLKIKMKLQTDPTILYAMYLRRGFSIEKNIRKKDILAYSPYNTYVIHGLPPGPIANPGKESLQAVFKPVQTNFLFFVSRNDGSHVFSKTYAEHKQFVYKYQILKFQKKQQQPAEK